MAATDTTIAILGGTGALGTGLARRWARAGYPLVIGSRRAEKGRAAAAALNRRVGAEVACGMTNEAAARAADIAVLTVPFAHHRTILEGLRAALQGKILVDATVPLVPPKVTRVRLPPEGAAAVAAQALLGDGVRVVSAFQTVAAAHLADESRVEEGDVLVAGNDRAARESVIALAEAAGLRGWHAGPIDNAVVGEAMTSVLIFINKTYGIDGAAIRVVGMPATDGTR